MPSFIKPYIFTDNEVAEAPQVIANFDTIYNGVNGSLDASNLSPTANIADTQLATIITGGSVNGSALTSLSSIPSAAGVVPIANIPTIPNSSLSTITTAGKVDGTSITDLVGIPSGAGQLAIVNGGTGTSSPAIVAGTNISVSGSWPNQTIINTFPGFFTTQNVVTSSRNPNTVYQNTTGKTMYVSVSINGADGAVTLLTAKSDS